jgi:drug/metabolite transporter (DMT)-like permease
MRMQDYADHGHLYPGVPLALGSALLFGATPPISKLMLGSLEPFMLAGLMYLGAGIGLALYRSLERGGEREAALTRADLPWLSLAIVFGGVAGPALLMLGLTRTTASNGALLLNLEGLATMAIAWLVYKEYVDRRLFTGAIAILAGAVLLSWNGEGVRFDAGALLVAAACLCWGIDNNLTRKISAADPVQIAMLKGLVAGTANTGLALAAGNAFPPMVSALPAAMTGLACIGISLVLFILALRHLGTARTGAYYSLAPFIGAVLSIALLGDPLTPIIIAAATMMGIGLWLHLTERHEHEHVHEAMEHEHMHVHDAHHQHDHDGPVTEPHSHWHRHEPLRHKHPHYPDLHHRHRH